MCKDLWNVICGVWLVYYEQNTIQLWYNWLKEGLEAVNDNASPGSPTTSSSDENIEVKNMILESLLGRFLMMLVYRSAHAKRFFAIKRTAAKIVPKLINFEQKTISIAQEKLVIQICSKRS